MAKRIKFPTWEELQKTTPEDREKAVIASVHYQSILDAPFKEVEAQKRKDALLNLVICQARIKSPFAPGVEIKIPLGLSPSTPRFILGALFSITRELSDSINKQGEYKTQVKREIHEKDNPVSLILAKNK